MANLNKVMLIGRLTRDPEPILNGKGAKFGFAVNNRKQNQDTQQWEDVPVFIDMEIWNRGEMGKNAERFLQTVRKGQQIFIEGHLKLDTWDDKNGGGKRSALRVVVETFQYLEPRAEGAEGAAPRTYQQAARPAGQQQFRQPARNAAPPDDDFDGSSMGTPAAGGRGGDPDDIPF
jgi:single-strand DNA-binding protein